MPFELKCALFNKYFLSFFIFIIYIDVFQNSTQLVGTMAIAVVLFIKSCQNCPGLNMKNRNRIEMDIMGITISYSAYKKKWNN